MNLAGYEYSEKDCLGKGGSASVYTATKGGVKYALKIYDKAALEEFGQGEEIRIQRQVELCGVEIGSLIKIFAGGYDKEKGTYYLVMEHLDWPSLEKVIGAVPDDAIPNLMSQLARAAKELEDAGIAHRDIKPANIHVSPDFKLLKLLDLGVIHPVDLTDEDISGGRFVGTLRYAPPEFALRKEKRDVDGLRAITFYQIGAVLHDMIMKKPLFSEYSKPKMALYKAVEFIPPIIRTVDKKLDYWAALAERCLAKNPRHRLRNVSWNDFFEQSSSEDEGRRIKEIGRRLSYMSELSTSGSEVGSAQDTAQAKKYFVEVANHICEVTSKTIRDDALFPFAEVYAPQRDLDKFEVRMQCSLKRTEKESTAANLLISISSESKDVNGVSLHFSIGDVALSETGPLSKHWLERKATSLVCDILDAWIASQSHEARKAGEQ